MRAVVCPVGRDRVGRATYAQWTFRQLDQESDLLARGLREIGLQPGCRMVLMVRPSLEFIALTFALFKAGAVIVLIDPGMGRTNIFKCLEEVDPAGFIAVPAVHWIRTLSRKFPNAKLNVRVGGRWAPGCVATNQSLRGIGFQPVNSTSLRATNDPCDKREIDANDRQDSGPLSPAIDVADTSDFTAGERARVRGTTKPLTPPHPGPLPHSHAHFELHTDGGGEGAEHGAARQAGSLSHDEFPITRTLPTDPAAVIFTSGSTGPPKGVLYEHGMFNAQVDMLQQFYGIEPGEVDLPGFPLFALFNAAMGVTTVIPDMDPTKPAKVDPLKIIEAINDNGVTQAFGSPAIWNRVGSHCVENGVELPSLRRALSAGGPVPIRVLEMMTKVLTGTVPVAAKDSPRRHGGTEMEEQSAVSHQPSARSDDQDRVAQVSNTTPSSSVPPCLRGETPQDVTGGLTPPRSPKLADLHTPYGATESLPVASISAREVLSRTAEKTRQGAGTCVGRAFPSIDIRIIPATDGPIASISDRHTLPPGEIGEIIVRSPAVTREYFRRPEPTLAAKIPDGDTFWHRMGDVGYLDDEGLLWFCGRKAHIVSTVEGPMYSVCCEGIFETHPQVFRAALVGIGPKGKQTPVLVVEVVPFKGTLLGIEGELKDLAQSFALTRSIETFEFIDAMPVDTRHNVKINREALAVWAQEQLR